MMIILNRQACNVNGSTGKQYGTAVAPVKTRCLNGISIAKILDEILCETVVFSLRSSFLSLSLSVCLLSSLESKEYRTNRFYGSMSEHLSYGR